MMIDDIYIFQFQWKRMRGRLLSEPWPFRPGSRKCIPSIHPSLVPLVHASCLPWLPKCPRPRGHPNYQPTEANWREGIAGKELHVYCCCTSDDYLLRLEIQFIRNQTIISLITFVEKNINVYLRPKRYGNSFMMYLRKPIWLYKYYYSFL
jgi:hypothetical protein